MFNRFRKLLLVGCLALLFSVTWAAPSFAALGDAPPSDVGSSVEDDAKNDMEDVLDAGSSDTNSETARYLHMLFGSLVDYGGDEGAKVQTLFGVYVQYLNYALFGLGSLMLSYFVVVGMMQTSADGEILGKKWSSTWVPVRITMAMLSMVPLPSGYLVIQVMLMKVALSSVAVTNWIYEKTIENYVDGGVSISAAAPPNANVPVMALTKMVLCQETLMYTERQIWLIKRDSTQLPNAVTIQEKVDEINRPNLEPYKRYRVSGDRIRDGKVVEPAVCGSLEYSQYNGDADAQTDVGFRQLKYVTKPIYEAHITSMRKMMRTGGEIDAIVQKIKAISFPNKPRDYQPTRDEIQDIRLSYDKAVSVYETTVMSKAQEEVGKLRKSSEKANALKTALMEAGWLHAGSFYLTIASLNREIYEAASMAPTFEEPRSIAPSNASKQNNIAYNRSMYALDGVLKLANGDPDFTPIHDFKRSYSDTVRDQEKIPSGFFEMGAEVLAKINSSFGELASMFEFGKGFQERYETEDGKYFANTLAELANHGHFWLNLMLGLVGLFVALSIASAFKKMTPVGFVTDKIMSLVSKGPSGPSIGSFGVGIGMIVGFVLSLAFAGAVFLALVLPAMPFLIWSTAVIGWFILIVEAVVGATFWALAHLMPNGEGLSGQAGQNGWQVLLSITARPLLMLGGLFGGMGVFMLAATYYLIAWDTAVNDILLGHSAGILTRILFAIFFVTVLVGLAERSFRFITWLPETVLRWMGVTVASLQDDVEDRQQRNMIMAGAGHTGQAVNRGSMAALALGKDDGGKMQNPGAPGGDKDGKGGGDKSATETVSANAAGKGDTEGGGNTPNGGNKDEGGRKSADPTEGASAKNSGSETDVAENVAQNDAKSGEDPKGQNGGDRNGPLSEV